MKVSSIIAVILRLALPGRLAGQESKEDPCNSLNFAECVDPPVAENPDEGKELWVPASENVGPGGPGGPGSSQCGPRCSRCRFNLCRRCAEGQLVLGRCVLSIDGDDLMGPTSILVVPDGYRGLNYNDVNSVRVDPAEPSGVVFGVTSLPRMLFVTLPFGMPPTPAILAPSGVTFGVFSLQITPVFCTPTIVTFQGDRANGDVVFHSEVLDFVPFQTRTHRNNINLFSKGFTDLVSFGIILSQYPGNECFYNNNVEILAFDDLVVF